MWEQFQAAITNAEEWLTTDGQIPARPLQGADDWPTGATIVLETNLKSTEVQSVCKYCNYQHQFYCSFHCLLPWARMDDAKSISHLFGKLCIQIYHGNRVNSTYLHHGKQYRQLPW